MRLRVDRERLQAFISEIGTAAQGPGKVYLVGGSSVLLLRIRDQTIDIDIKLDPEPKAVFEAIALLKEKLSINVELAAPDQFLPALPGWQERSEFIARSGQVDFYHYDFYAQALSKLLRGHQKDVDDAAALVRLGKVVPSTLRGHFESIQNDLIRYPGIDPRAFAAQVENFISRFEAVDE